VLQSEDCNDRIYTDHVQAFSLGIQYNNHLCNRNNVGKKIEIAFYELLNSSLRFARSYINHKGRDYSTHFINGEMDLKKWSG
jgi:hypothetical protein